MQAAIGEELESEKYLITIEENVSSDKPTPEAVNHEMAPVNKPDHRPHTQAPRRQLLKRKRTVSNSQCFVYNSQLKAN